MGAAVASTGLVIGRYVLFDEIAAGGMATVHLGRLVGAVGFSRTVAIKRLHPNLAKDADFVSMFLDEARIAARIRHPNVVGVLDVVNEDDEIFLVMDYVEGASLSRLARAARPGVIPARVAVTAITDVLHGLHAAHEATDDQGRPLGIVHRDVSPQNVIIGTDGVARVLDFGVAKAAHRIQSTQDGMLKGKIAYMAPEQILSENIDRRADVYSAAVVLWEALTGERLFDGENQGRVVRKILDEPIPVASERMPGLPKALDEAVKRGLERDPTKRWQTAREFAGALERCMPMAPATEIGEWVESIAGGQLREIAKRVKEIESRSDITPTKAPGESERRLPRATEIEVTCESEAEPLAPKSPESSRQPVSAVRPLDRQLKTMPLAMPVTPPGAMRPIRTVAMEVMRPQTPSSPVLTRDSSPEAIDELLASNVPSRPPPVRSRRRRALVLLLALCLVAGGAVTLWLRLHGRL
jgi:eukaryotic-like serine/threonine-protein kinase